MPPTAFRRVAPEVYYADGGFYAVGPEEIGLLKQTAAGSPRKRARLCLHGGPDDTQQEMVIVMHRDAYVRPHRHHDKVETFSMLEGRCRLLTFEEDGTPQKLETLCPPGSGQPFFYRMPTGLYHTLLFDEEWTVFIETTVGPFDPGASEGASWAPPEDDPRGGHAFLQAVVVSASSVSKKS